jgi:hypothetical protein
MDKVRVFYDRGGNTLTVWFGDPAGENVCEETGEEVTLIKNREWQVVGFEKLNFSHSREKQVTVAFETVSP